MPWLSEEIPGWEELTDDEREALRAVARDHGMHVDDNDDDDDGYYE